MVKYSVRYGQGAFAKIRYDIAQLKNLKPPNDLDTDSRSTREEVLSENSNVLLDGPTNPETSGVNGGQRIGRISQSSMSCPGRIRRKRSGGMAETESRLSSRCT